MAARGRVPKNSDGRPVQAHATTRHGGASFLNSVSGHRQLELSHHPELLETKIAAQAAEIKQLVGDNQRLVSTHVVLREELAAARQEVQRLKPHMRSIQTESDIQIQILVDKIARAEMSIVAGEGVKNELQRAIKEAQNLVVARQELNVKIQEAAKELQKARDDIKSLPSLRSELDSLRKEHQRLRSTFEYEKGSNIEQVDQLLAMEQKLILMSKEVENLRVHVFNAEKRTNAPQSYSGGYANPDFPYPPAGQVNVAYVDNYSRPHVPVNHQMGSWPEAGNRTHEQRTSGVIAPSSSVDPTSGGSIGPSKEIATSTNTAGPGSAGASASTSGGDTVKEGKCDPADTQGSGCISDY